MKRVKATYRTDFGTTVEVSHNQRRKAGGRWAVSVSDDVLGVQTDYFHSKLQAEAWARIFAGLEL